MESAPQPATALPPPQQQLSVSDDEDDGTSLSELGVGEPKRVSFGKNETRVMDDFEDEWEEEEQVSDRASPRDRQTRNGDRSTGGLLGVLDRSYAIHIPYKLIVAVALGIALALNTSRLPTMLTDHTQRLGTVGLAVVASIAVFAAFSVLSRILNGSGSKRSSRRSSRRS
jgi:hypothetical protein